MTDLVERLRETLGGIAQEECGGDNLAILLASYFEPGIESEELNDTGTWKQGAIDACDKVLDAIHAHYATALEAAEARAEIAARERDEAQFGFENELKIKQELAGALRDAQRERDEAREALKNVKAAILEASIGVVTDTLWLSQRISHETAVDHIDIALGDQQ